MSGKLTVSWQIFTCIACGSCCIFSVPTVVEAIYQRNVIDAADVPWSEQTKTIVEGLRDSSKGFLQTSVALIAGAWAVLVLQKDNKAIFSTWVGVFGLFAATFCLAMSAWSYLRLDYTLIQYLQRSARASPTDILRGLPDLNSPFIRSLLDAQVIGLAGGAICLAITLVPQLRKAGNESTSHSVGYVFVRKRRAGL